MPNLIIIVFLVIFQSTYSLAETLAGETTEVYEAEARDNKGSLLYTEKHEVKFSNKKVVSAKTEYFRPSGEKIAVLSSDFRKLITAPQYSFIDVRDNSSHGVDLIGEKFILWRQGSDGKREESAFKKDDFDKEALVVGCQGLHYYLIDNFDVLKQKKKLSLKYLIPGKLDYYSFTARLDGEDENNIYVTLRIDSIILRLFTSELKLKYSKNEKRLLTYHGLSNLANDSGSLQVIDLIYKYNGVPKENKE